MVYLFTNITDSSSDPKDIYIGDIDGIQSNGPIAPGETVDLELHSTRNQICVSHHIKVHVLEGRATVDTLGTEPDKDCRVWVTGIDVGDIVIDNISIEEPIQISADVDGVETALTATAAGGSVYLDVNPLLPNIPEIECIDLPTANTEEAFALPINTKQFMILLEEGDSDLQFAFTPGGNTITIPCGGNYSAKDVDAGATTLYFKAGTASRTVKVLTWSVG